MNNNIISAPMKKYAPPKYPTQAEAQLSPELLRKLPARWQKNAAVMAAAGLFGVITLSSCGILEPDIAGYNPQSENYLNVAPIFIHGEGTGSMGCVMVAPPVFLSEQEALAIIINMAESEGLNFNAEPPDYKATDNRHRSEQKYSWNQEKYVLGDGSVGLDLYDNKTGVAVTFISMQDAEQKFDNEWRSVTSYLPRELAELTAEDFAQQKGDINVGVFYDPGKDWDSEEYQRVRSEYNASDKDWEERMAEYEEAVKELISENLRSQVRDFIEWLQGQGVI